MIGGVFTTNAVGETRVPEVFVSVTARYDKQTTHTMRAAGGRGSGG